MTRSTKRRQRLQPGSTRAPCHSLDRLVRRLEARIAAWKRLEYVRRRERNFWREKYIQTEKALHYVHAAQAKIYNITAATLWPPQEQRQAPSSNDRTERRLPPALSNDNTKNANGGRRSLE